MRISLKNTYKSLEPFKSESLQDFVVITGKNGSGKSQLIQLIADEKSGQLEITPNLKQIQVEGMDFNRVAAIDHNNWKIAIDTQWTYYAGLDIEKREALTFLFENNIYTREELLNFPMGYHEEELINIANILLKKSSLPHFNSSDRGARLLLIANSLSLNATVDLHLIEWIASYTDKSVTELKHIDFYNTPFEERFVDKNDLFSSEIAMVFYNYVKRWDQNGRDYYDKISYNRVNKAITDDDFLKKYPKPWETVNRILASHGLDFEFVSHDRIDFNRDVPVHAKLKKRSNNQVIAFEDLSSGEKIIMSLITRLFTSEYYGEHLKFPELLVLDEPDATLHPEMSKLLLDVLEKTFVNQFGIKVIITTHSPSTVALAPDGSIYQLTNGAETTLKRVSKDVALKILTNFLPTLSIGYQNQRQVFVESPTDVAYFQMLHDKIYQQGSNNYRLYFISNAMGKGNSDLVYKTTKSMRDAGSKSVFGIVDWDKKNTTKDAVHVHATDVAYSIENIIVDPIYLMMLFASLGAGAFNVFEIINKDQHYNHYLLGNESQEELQRIADIIFEKLTAAFPTFTKEEERRGVKYYNGKTLQYPIWYLDMIGHELVPKFDKIFTGLSGKYPKEGDLQKALIPVIGKAFPFVPLISVELLNQIENS